MHSYSRSELKIAGAGLYEPTPESQQSTRELHIPEVGQVSEEFVDIKPANVKAFEKTLEYAGKRLLLEEFFLETLAFTTMSDREEEISEAHSHTFEWIFQHYKAGSGSQEIQQPKDSFTEWLEGNSCSPVYWINGKAGSGKSTLMRYIYDQQKTFDYLKAWAGDLPLLRARFFLWTSGNVDQKSHAGLLRALLHQLLSERKDMIPWVFPDLWMICQDTKRRINAQFDWSVDRLFPSILKFLDLTAGEYKLCLFIDGLDEVQGHEKELVRMVEAIVKASEGNVKACVSSRPWQVFEESFLSIPQLKLQELTSNDISRYVDDILKNTPKVWRILKREPDAAQDLKQKIVQMADGVFLWATLAVKTLVERVGSGDKVADAVLKLSKLPTDLDALFTHLLFESKEDPDELEQQSQILQIIRAREEVCDFTRDESSNTITIYQLALALDGESISMDDEIEAAPDDEILDLCDSTTKHLEDRCSGLLIAHKQANTQKSRTRFQGSDQPSPRTVAQRKVGYLHRTVRDFLTYSGSFEFVKKQTTPSFDPHMALLVSNVLQMRIPLESPDRHRRLNEWWPDVVLSMTHARYMRPNQNDFQVHLLNRFNATLDWYWVTKDSDPLDNWARNAFGSYELRMKHRIPFYYPFLSLSAKFGLVEYLRSELASNNYPYKGGIPLLTYAVEFLADRRKSVYPFSTPELIEMLLKSGQDPNLQYKTLTNIDETPWLYTLKCVREANRRGWISSYDINEYGTKRWAKILLLFINHGANPNALILKDSWDPAATVLDIIDDIYEKYLSKDIKDVLGNLCKAGAVAREKTS
jgi:hypothetical protein